MNDSALNRQAWRTSVTKTAPTEPDASAACELRTTRRRPFVPATATVRAATGWSDLARGTVDGLDFVFSCPIDRLVVATARGRIGSGIRVQGLEPDTARHVADLLRRVARQHGIDPRLRLRIHGPASAPLAGAPAASCVAAALGAFVRYLDIAIDPAVVAEFIAATGQPDGLQHPGIAEVDPLTGQLHGCWPAPRDLRLLLLDAGSGRDRSVVHPLALRALHFAHQDEVRQFHAMLRYGLIAGDARAIGEAATRSTRLMQQLAPWPAFASLERSVADAGGYGICSIPNGRRLGVIHADSPQLTEQLTQVIEGRLGAAVSIVGVHRLVGGGCTAVS